MKPALVLLHECRIRHREKNYSLDEADKSGNIGPAEQKVENTPNTYIIGKFNNCEKEYTWKVTKNIPLEVGDRVLVRTKCKNGKNGNGVVTVVQVFTSDKANMLRHKPVIKKLRASVSECLK